MERCSVSLRIQSKCGKIWTRITPNTDTFYSVVADASDAAHQKKNCFIMTIHFITYFKQYSNIVIEVNICLVVQITIGFWISGRWLS